MDTNVNSELSKRLAIIEGHVKKIRKMLEDNFYCPDIIHQSHAVQAALRKVDEIILHNHLHSCVLNDYHESDSKKEKLVQELVDLFKKNGK